MSAEKIEAEAERLAQMTPPKIETRADHIFDVFQPGLIRGAERLAYAPHKRYFYVEHPTEGWRVYLRSACMIHELYKPYDATRFLVVKRTGADTGKTSWEAPKGQMEAKDGLGKDRKPILQLLKENIRREVEEEAKISRLRELTHTGLVIQAVEPDFPPNTYFHYHIFSAYAHPLQIEGAFQQFEYLSEHPGEFRRLRADQREKDAIRWYSKEETKLMGRWSPTIVKLYLQTFS
jgi:8-oxo-dGTP pyrophosphatase MutT (NUDIX family)